MKITVSIGKNGRLQIKRAGRMKRFAVRQTTTAPLRKIVNRKQYHCFADFLTTDGVGQDLHFIYTQVQLELECGHTKHVRKKREPKLKTRCPECRWQGPVPDSAAFNKETLGIIFTNLVDTLEKARVEQGGNSSVREIREGYMKEIQR